MPWDKNQAANVCAVCRAPQKDPTVVAFLRLELHDDGSMSTEGNIGDVKLALGMLDSARAAISSSLGRGTIGVVIPNRDVIAPQGNPAYPLIAEGDRKP